MYPSTQKFNKKYKVLRLCRNCNKELCNPSPAQRYCDAQCYRDKVDKDRGKKRLDTTIKGMINNMKIKIKKFNDYGYEVVVSDDKNIINIIDKNNNNIIDIVKLKGY